MKNGQAWRSVTDDVGLFIRNNNCNLDHVADLVDFKKHHASHSKEEHVALC